MALRQRASCLALRMLSTMSTTAAGATAQWSTLPSTGTSILCSARSVFFNNTRRTGHGYQRFYSSLPEHQQLAMPALSPTMSQGNIVSWKKKEGDSIQPGDIYCEVETDKATIEWESQEEGFLAKILIGEGTKNIDVGTPVAILVEEEGDVAAFKDYAPDASSSSSAPAPKEEKEPAAAAAPPSSSQGSYPAHEIMSMPALSPTMSQGNILTWKKKEGDEVQPGDILAEVETDKATIEWEAQEEGVIAKILVPEGTSGVEVGAPVMVMVDDKDSVAAFEKFSTADAGAVPAPAPPPKKEQAQQKKPAAAPTQAPKKQETAARQRPAVPQQPGERIIASPYAKKLAMEAGISLSGAAGSGPRGRIIADDVHQLIASGGARPAGVAAATPTGAAFTDIETTQIRRVIARRLLESKQTIPHYYLTVSCRIDRLAEVRQQLNAFLATSDGGKLSVNDFVIKASALALKKVPEVNASWYGDFIRQYHTIDCSVAVQTPAGLMVPIVKNADRKGLSAIAAEVKDLATRAKAGKLAPEEFTGGTFTISNLGMFGVTSFAAIVNPPQSCILAVGGAEEKVVVGKNGGFEEGTFMNVTLSCDHRVVDGAVGAAWLQAFKTFVEDPASMLL